MSGDFQLMPEQASSVAAEVDAVYLFEIAVSAFFTILIAFLIIYFAIKYRRGSPADRTQGKSHFYAMELTWIVVPFVLTMIMFFWGARVYFHQVRAPAGAMEITCVARQWMWKFQHPAGQSEINDLHVPHGELVVLQITSEDVLHSFFLPNARVKQDVIPGMQQFVWFRPLKSGEYDIVCAELCGWGHYKMKGRLTVEPATSFRRWLEQQEDAQNFPNRPEDLEVASNE